MGLIILCFIVPIIIAIVLAIKDRDGEFIFFGLIGGFLFGHLIQSDARGLL